MTVGKPVVIAVSGVKNSGKTTLIEAMLPLLADMGLGVAVIKHDGHCFDPDPPGTDTGRFMAAGAAGTAIFDGEKFKIVKKQPVTEDVLISQFPEADLILLEGFKHTPWPKLEVVRGAISQAPVSDPATLLGLVTDLDLALPGIPILPLGEPKAAADLLLDYIQKERKHHA
ncbi:molybdopterin-guanine dinucleotide biosynthesis protein B [Intestinimonas massiliensis (ex Afouda et al. 2020)]|uniref:molybdopterin-guanine dinucleotide biosynthesis protein B n=1 Tax=Intestinimonas massiliensis (ex Afouda et al. 2020) TaxID=1673721 RepID=UPI0010314960|nr:molybdopterin-guanine dinucleotide biosynthesis protein B [Intestinimonas massiliensis (ex Afouda et al. 2020)]